MGNQPPHVLTRTALYELVWSEPVATAAQRYKLSGNGLAKICKKHNIPLPPRGYWAKLQHGKKPHRPTLRPASNADAETVRITEGDGPRPAPPPPSELEPRIAAAISKARDPENRIVVPETGGRRHHLVAEMARSHDQSWDGTRNVVEPLEQRRRRILDAFFRAIERQRGRLELNRHNDRFEVTLFGSTFVLTCSEPEHRVRVPLTKAELRSRPSGDTRDWKNESKKSGVLRMRVQRDDGKLTDFVDAEGAPLEGRLTDVLVYLLSNSITVEERDRRAEAVRQARQDAQRRQHEEELRRWELEQQRRKEQQRVAALVEQAAKWRQAQDIRAYVEAARLRADEAWASWALAVADSIDPLATQD